MRGVFEVRNRGEQGNRLLWAWVGAAAVGILAMNLLCAGCAAQAEHTSGFEISGQGSDGSSAQSLGSAGEDVEASQNAAWGKDADCASCHVETEIAVEGSSGVAGFHITKGLADCFACHVDDDALSEVHETADAVPPSKLKHTSVDASICEACHSKEEVATATEGSTVLVDENGTVVNPHFLPESDDHDALTCLSCHSGHEEMTLEKAARSACTSCHHDNVYECHTCHD